MKSQTQLEELYLSQDLGPYEQRISQLTAQFKEKFPENKGEPQVFSVAGRIEVGGNHTDHQLGCVLCASIHLDTLAVAGPREDGVIRIESEGYPSISLSIDQLDQKNEEKNTTLALIRGICYQFQEKGYGLGGFQAVITSNVLKGSGMSSSASFEGMIGLILNHFYCKNQVDLVELAKIGQFAENVYFGKPSGLMDQLGCLLGGFCFIDFHDPEKPEIKQVDSTELGSKYDVCIMDTGDAHDDLTADYAAIPQEMGQVAGFFGETYLSRVKETDFYEKLPELKNTVGDRAILRAIHFFQDSAMAKSEYQAIESGNLEEFLRLVTQSGRSSQEKLQNIYANHQPQVQGAGLILSLCQKFLGEKGAYRIHGGGFGGTVQAFVPKALTPQFKAEIERVMGADTCHIVSIRSKSATILN